ncbi:hypothetical protein [Phycisphaera mikurensis]|uniref:Uncharacterized protein n=1 Tax=Phycisphaera mikurensis (strain NBRC 102666 / KCTC 22515 / FYK2301M01) TaxID=1142394 RepID=I0IFU5_PHYMF|nr:hypothetical protein [Phycisphaera mikurensis]MBB6440478.1 hypothetical protein [Phycisphaera mikurensis]BAM04133.1 hypothetical protein PSMK_19740 [Phycisphaera mikurensis NBRC 102666]
MPGPAKVHSIEQLADFRRLLVKIEEAIGASVGSADAGIRSTQRWLADEQPRVWAQRRSRAVRALDDAQATLRRKQLSPTPSGKPASVAAEQKALRRAKQLVEECERKLALTRTWSRRFEKVEQDYRTGTSAARAAAAGGVAEAGARLDGLLGHLDGYRRVLLATRDAAEGPGTGGGGNP